MAPSHVVLSCLAVLACARAASDFYVAPSGSDANNGLAPDTAFLTVQRAQVAVDVLPRPLAADVVVHVAAGLYYLGSTLSVRGGDANFAVSYVGAGAGATTLSAGAKIVGWTAVAGQPGVFSAPVPARAGASFLRQLFPGTDGSRRTLQRSRVMTATAVGQWGVAFAPGDVSPAMGPSLAEAECVIWHCWVSSQNKIKAVDFANSSIALVGQAGDPFFSAGGLRWALQNVNDPAGLAAGSFFTAAGVVFYRALPGEDPTAPATTTLVGELLPEAVRFAGTASVPVVNVHLLNLTIAHAAAALEETCLLSQGCGGQSVSESTTAAVHATFAVGCSVDGVEVVGPGSYAVWWDEGCVGSSIRQSWLHSLGMGGVRVGNGDNTGSPSTAPATDIEVTDCVIEDAGLVVPAGTGILAQECANTTILHNHVHHLFYTAISTGWSWGYMASSDAGHRVAFNLLHDVFQNELSDGGCIYNLGRSPGTVIENNLCHTSNPYDYGGWGLYTDEGSSNVTLRNNIVFSTKDASFHQHYGTDNLIENNVFAFGSSLPCVGDCDDAALRSSQHPVASKDAGVNSSFTFARNIVLLGAPDPSIAPAAANVTHIFKTNGPTLGVDNMTFASNLYWHNALADPASQLVFGASGNPLSFVSWQAASGKDKGSVIADPLFVDPEGFNFALQPGSPALALGFVPIDMSTVGVRSGPFRQH